MKQNKLNQMHIAFLFICISLSLIIVPVQSDEEYHVIVTLQAPEPNSSGGFGTETKMFEGGLVVGACASGKAYIYDSNWNLTTILHSPPISLGERFGNEVDVHGNKLAISNLMATVDDLDRAGKVYLFDFDGSLKIPMVTSRRINYKQAAQQKHLTSSHQTMNMKISKTS